MDEQEFRSILSDYEKMLDADIKENAALREAIAAWPVQSHKESCHAVFSYRGGPTSCDCGAEEANTAREFARRVAGLED